MTKGKTSHLEHTILRIPSLTFYVMFKWLFLLIETDKNVIMPNWMIRIEANLFFSFSFAMLKSILAFIMSELSIVIAHILYIVHTMNMTKQKIQFKLCEYELLKSKNKGWMCSLDRVEYWTYGRLSMCIMLTASMCSFSKHRNLSKQNVSNYWKAYAFPYHFIFYPLKIQLLSLFTRTNFITSARGNLFTGQNQSL